MPDPQMLTPRTLEDLVGALGQATPRSRLLAGGTDLVRIMRHDHWAPDLLIDLSGVRELDFVRLEGEVLRIGATSTFATLQAHPLVLRHARCLAQAAAQVGSAQIRNVATVAGNIANASACADSATALVALGAEAETIDAQGRTTMRPVEQLSAGAGRTCLAPGEAIVSLAFPALGEDQPNAFTKIGSRSTVTVARLSMALVMRYDAVADTVSEARVGLGAIAEAAFRDSLLEELLEGRPADEESARLFAEGCIAAVRRSIPGRYSLPYKQYAVVGLAYDAWNGLGICAPCQPHWA
jgi:xanthine dehydrogenase FAD-binding subunit